MRIEIAEIKNRGKYDVFLGGELICHETRTPLCSAARVLLARGANPDTMLEKVRRGSSRVDVRARLGTVAKLTVADGGTHTPQFVKFQPFPAISPFTASEEPTTELRTTSRSTW